MSFEEGLAAYKKGDYATALGLWNPLANQGDANTQYNLGLMYRLGHGVSQDFAEAARWLSKAAGQGHAGAQCNLGFMFKTGEGVPQDFAKAEMWFRKAADQGLADAQYYLGEMYVNGEGVGRDYVQAHMWLDLTTRLGDNSAAYKRDLIAKDMTPAQIAKAQRLAREWKPK